jgi:hypothetical protein
MSPVNLFRIHLVFGYVAWLLCFRVYLWPWLKAANRFDAQRAIATLLCLGVVVPSSPHEEISQLT